MKKIRQIFRYRLAVKVVIVIMFLLLFNSFAVSFGFSFLSQKVPFLMKKSRKTVMSDLMFIEGGLMFTIGVLGLLRASVLRMETRSYLRSRSEEHGEYSMRSRKKRFALGTILIVVGASFIGLSIVVSLI